MEVLVEGPSREESAQPQRNRATRRLAFFRGFRLWLFRRSGRAEIGLILYRLGGEPMNDQAAHDEILEFLALHNTLTLATERDGIPWAASLFYAHDGLTLYFISDRQARHAQYLASNPRIAATINQDCHTWSEIKGLQIAGLCEEVVRPADIAWALKIYTARFSFLANLLQAPPELGAAMAKATFYRIKPNWVRLVDNSRGFGWKQAIRFD